MLESLERASGLPIALDPVAGRLRMPAHISIGAVSQRTGAELAPFLANGSAAPEGAVYTVYRSVARADDREIIAASKLRYDITVIPPGTFAGPQREYFRTAGHYHLKKPEAAVAWPEVYEVISGRACWIIQKPAADDPAAVDAIYAIEAGPGEKAIVLPGFGHISANAFSKPLVMANWISNAFEYDYEPFRRLRGAAYWVTADAGAIAFARNANYRAAPKLTRLRPREIPEFGLVRSEPLYTLALRLEQLAFLNAPERYADALALDRCYRVMP